MTLKDQFFNEDTTLDFANLLAKFHDININTFVKDAIKLYPTLELKGRISQLRKTLKEYMPSDYTESMAIFTKMLVHTQQSHFTYAAIMEYIEYYGCDEKYVALSLEKLGEFTQYFTAEFAIRSFINHFEALSLETIYNWSLDSDFHKRRLASEGTRPRLPWAMNITMEYKKSLRVLNNLYYDTERYVTRSVANHLNDISKIDPNYVIEILKSWKKQGKQNKDEMNYIINHSLRSLIKNGNQDALTFLGFNENPKVEVELRLSKPEYSIGEYLEFHIDILPLENTNLVIDYSIHYPTKAGNISKKVYKIKTSEVFKNKPISIKRKNKLEIRTTRKLVSGKHQVFVHINGKILASKYFNII